ncbi:thioesterase [Ruegeria sediminis]|uniref:Thioesterase n=1 Tax=Ruegeria sediminis TaxID=2583820 RepID=A0ABY2WYN9_9RHOB|nr:thioesterase family protein [Ruegeria sediminis]TMV07653.1 thioesterase [Ruegeria sediminis]
MTQTPPGGHDGPYPAPVEVRGFTVKPEWIDYNGHMNVGYYGVAFDLALEEVMVEHLGLGGVQVEATGEGPYMIQSHLHFLRELREGEPFYYRLRLLDADGKRGHYFAEMFAEADGALCATQEGLFINVSHATGRSAPYPEWAAARLARMVEDHKSLEPAPQIGQPIGIRRKQAGDHRPMA